MNKEPIAWVVVKHAKEWELHFRVDPTTYGVDMADSAHKTHVGKVSGCLPFYFEQDNAQKMARMMNKVNAMGQYAPCPVFEP